MVEIDTLKTAKKKQRKKKHTLCRGTYLYSRHKGLPPPPPPRGEKRVADLSLAAFASETIKQYILQF